MKSYQNNRDEFKKMPTTSGLYYFYDKNNELLYIGKAKSLRARTLMHQRANLQHREGMFLRKITLSKKLSLWKRVEWPKELDISWREFEFKSMSRIEALVIDYIFKKIIRIETEEIPKELIKSKEKEMIQKFKPPFNYETACEEYFRLRDEFE